MHKLSSEFQNCKSFVFYFPSSHFSSKIMIYTILAFLVKAPNSLWKNYAEELISSLSFLFNLKILNETNNGQNVFSVHSRIFIHPIFTYPFSFFKMVCNKPNCNTIGNKEYGGQHHYLSTIFNLSIRSQKAFYTCPIIPIV